MKRLRFTMTITKTYPDVAFSYRFSGGGDVPDAPLIEMLTAMREGLEANGYDVRTLTEHTTEVEL